MKVFLVVVGLVLLTACSKAPEPISQTFYVFGTEVNISIVGADKATANRAIQAIEQDFQAMNREWHAWEKGGLVSKINTAIAQGKSIEVSPPIKAFIEKSQRLAELSGYRFDPAIGALVDLWGFHSEDWRGPPPSDAAIQQYLQHRPSIAQLSFQGLELSSSNSSVQLDFGGNAKGLALDRAIQTLKASHIENAIVNIGGDMRVIGSKNGENWRIGIQNPLKPAEMIQTVQVSGDWSVVTSGTYARFFEWKGQRYSHLLNPVTGQPARGLASVSVIHPDATTADSAATALLIAGDEWRSVAQKMGIQYVLVVTEQGEIQMTHELKNAPFIQ